MALNEDSIKKYIGQVQKAINALGNQTQEQASVNRELLKVIALLEQGLARNEAEAHELIQKVRAGTKITDKFAKSWAADRQASAKDLETIFGKFKKIKQIHGEINEQAEDLNDMLDDRLDSMDMEIDLSAKLFDSYDDINKAIVQSKKSAQALGVQSDTVLAQILDKRIPALVKGGLLSPLFDDMFNSMEAADDLTKKLASDVENMIASFSNANMNVPLNFDIKDSEKLDKEIAKVRDAIELENQARLAGLVNFFDQNEEMQQNMVRSMAAQMSDIDITFDPDTGNVMRANDKLVKGTQDYSMALKQLDKIALDQNLASNVRETFLDISELVGIGVDRTDEQNALLDGTISKLDRASQYLVKAVIERQKELAFMKESFETDRKRLVLMDKFSIHMQAAENAVIKVGQGFDYINSILPAGIGEIIGLQKVSFGLLDAHREGAKGFFEEISKGTGPVEALGNYFKSFGPSLKLALNPAVLMVGAFALMFKFVSDITGKLKELSGNMGVSLQQADQFYHLQKDILTSQENQFATLEEIEAMQTAMINAAGTLTTTLTDSSKQLTIDLIEMSKAFGYGAEQAAELHEIFTDMGASNEMAANLQANLGLMSEMAGISPKIISQDLIDGADEVFTYFMGIPDQAAKAAIEVRRLGMSIKQAGQIAQKMLDLEGFMTDMFELQAMTGPGGIDFSRAFDKGLMGDIEGMTKEIMDQIGSTAELSQMDYLTRQKIAKTLGMSNAELGQAVALREKMNQLDPATAAALEGNLDRMGDISKLSKDQIKDRLKQLQSTDRLNVAWDKIKGIFVKSLLPLVEAFADILDAISPILDVLIGGFKIIGYIIQGITTGISWIVKGVTMLADAVGGVMGLFGGVNNEVEKTQQPIAHVQMSLLGIGDVVKSIGSAIALWFVGGKLLGGLGLVKKGLGSMLKIVPFVGGAFKKMFGGVVKDSKKAQLMASKNLSQISEAAPDMDGGKKKKKSLFSAVAPKIFGLMAFDAAKSFVGFGKEAEDSIDGVSTHASMMFGGMMLMGDELFEYLEYGVRKVFQETIGKRFAKGLEPLKGMAKKTFDKFPNPFKKTKEVVEQTVKTVEPISKKVTDTAKKGIETVKKTESVPKVEAPKKIPKVPKELVGKKKIEAHEIPTPKVDTKKQTSVMDKVVKSISGALKGMTKVIKESWKMLKSTLTEILNFSMKVLKTVAQGVADVIQKLLGGIAKGLNQFKTSAIKGAAALVLVSGAFFITAKAMQEFSKVSWDDVAKGTVTLGGLIAAGYALSKITGDIIKGAAAIALLGASLVPAAFAMQMFNDIEATSILKAAGALVVLGAAALGLGAIMASGVGAVAMLSGAAAIAALGAALIPLAFAMEKFNDIDWTSMLKAGVAVVAFGAAFTGFGLLSPLILAGSAAVAAMGVSLIVFAGAVTLATSTISELSPEIEALTEQIKRFATIDPARLLGVAAAITAVGASLVAFSAMNLGASLASTLSSMFEGDPINKLERLSKLADPLSIVAESIGKLSSSLLVLSGNLQNISLDNLDGLEKITNFVPKELTSKVQQELEEPVTPELPEQMAQKRFTLQPMVRDNTKVQRPSRESVAQNIEIPRPAQLQEQQEEPASGIRAMIESPEFQKNSEARQTNLLLRELINIMRIYAERPNEISIGKSGLGQLNTALKAFNNG